MELTNANEKAEFGSIFNSIKKYFDEHNQNNGFSEDNPKVRMAHPSWGAEEILAYTKPLLTNRATTRYFVNTGCFSNNNNASNLTKILQKNNSSSWKTARSQLIMPPRNI